VSKARLNAMRGVEHHDRIDAELYHDYESDEARKVGVAGGRGGAGCPGGAVGRQDGGSRRWGADEGVKFLGRSAAGQAPRGVAWELSGPAHVPFAPDPPQRRLAKEAKEKERLEKLASKVRRPCRRAEPQVPLSDSSCTAPARAPRPRPAYTHAPAPAHAHGHAHAPARRSAEGRGRGGA
jgi:hypothetical protein